MRKVEMLYKSDNSAIRVKGQISNDILNRDGETIGYEVMYDSNGKKKFIICMLNKFKVISLKNVNIL